MEMEVLRLAGQRLLEQARVLRVAFPDPVALLGLPIDPIPDGAGWPGLRAAMKYLWDEMVLVRDGRAGTLAVLDDEIATTERELARLSLWSEAG